MRISVVIPTKDRQQAVVAAVDSVFEHGTGDFEVYVVDQSTVEDTERALLSKHGARATFHYHKNLIGRAGASSSRNIGIALSTGEVVANIDDDVTVTRDWMPNIRREFGADPELKFICGKLTAPEHDPTEGCIPSFDAPADLTRYEAPLRSAGANYIMHRSIIDRVGGYDENWGPGSAIGVSDDGDIAWRIVRTGVKWKTCSEVEVVHTFGFRPSADATKLLSSYQVGLGGNFGRFTRRGDFFATYYFVKWQLRDAINGIYRLARGYSDNGLGWVKDRQIGFARGFSLPASRGFVSGADLTRMKAELSDGVPVDSHDGLVGVGGVRMSDDS